MTPLKSDPTKLEPHEESTPIQSNTLSSHSADTNVNPASSWTTAAANYADALDKLSDDPMPSDESINDKENGKTMNHSNSDKKMDATVKAHSESPKSAFRQSLEMHSSGRTEIKGDGNNDVTSSSECNKSLLRNQMSTTILTHTERTFLESLLALEDDIADALCCEARKRLSGAAFDNGDSSKRSGGVVNLFGACHDSLCLGEAAAPVHHWQARQESLGQEEWVKAWVSAGGSGDKEDGISNIEKEGSDGLDGDSLAKALPYALERTENIPQPNAAQPLTKPAYTRQPSTQQIERLAYKKRQSSQGHDSTTRLYKAHEAGLVVSQKGSARRSLARLGLDIDVTQQPQQPSITPAGAVSAAVQRGHHDENENAAHQAFHTNSPSREEERSIRKLEQNERTKQKHRQHALAELDVLASRTNYSHGIVSPFTSNFLKNIYASRQFSFKRESSSYSRYDSFLNESEHGVKREREDSGIVIRDDVDNDDNDLPITDSTSDTESPLAAAIAKQQDDIFRPAPMRRLHSLIQSAGFNEATPRGTRLVEAEPESDAISIDNSVRKLLLRGGPSFREDHVFRREDEDDNDEAKQDEMKPVEKFGPRQIKLGQDIITSSGRSSLIDSDFDPATPTLSGSFFPVTTTASRDEDDEQEDKDDNKDRTKGDISPSNSEVGDLPPPARGSLLRGNSTRSIIKRSSSASLQGRRNSYQRSVSWGHLVGKEDFAQVGSPRNGRKSDTDAINGLSVISFPNIRRAAPLRSDSLSSVGSIGPIRMAAPLRSDSLSSIGPLRLGTPLRSESMGSMASALSGIPTLSRAHPISSPRNSLDYRMQRIPSIHRALRLRSESTATLNTEYDDYSDNSYSEIDDSLNTRSVLRYSDIDDSLNTRYSARQRSVAAAWTSPFAPKRWIPPKSYSRQSSSTSIKGLSRQNSEKSLTGKNILIRQASLSNYEGEGMEIDEVDLPMSLGSARNQLKPMLSIGGGDSVVSGRSRSSRISVPFTSLDDGFIVRNFNFERHSSEILRSLSNEDLYSSHRVDTIGGASSVARVYGDLMEGDSKSWDMQDENSLAPPQNAWNILEDEYAEDYGAYNSLAFQILGTSADDEACHPHVLSPPLMESLQNFLPTSISECNFWLKYSLVRDGASLSSLLRQVRGAQHTLIAMETVDGEVFGCFTSSPWRKTWNYYGNGEAFLWRMRRTRSDKDAQRSILDQAKLESELDVFYWTGKNNLVQLCTHDMLAVGGGVFHSYERTSSLSDEERDMPPSSAGDELAPSHHADKGGFGLAIDAELLRGTSSPCATFNSPPLSREHSDGSPFEIVNLEVWTMTPCMTVEDAEQLEMRKLFLEPYSSAQ